MTEHAENAGNAPWEWWSPAQVSQITGIPRPTLYAWVYRGGKGPPHYKLGESVRYRSDEVLGWLAHNRRAGDGTVPPQRARGRNGRFIRISA